MYGHLRIIGLRCESKRLADSCSDGSRVGLNRGDPAPGLVGAGSSAAAHSGDHRLELVNSTDAAFDLAEFAAHDAAAFCLRLVASWLARLRTAETRALLVASSSVPFFATADTL